MPNPNTTFQSELITPKLVETPSWLKVQIPEGVGKVYIRSRHSNQW